MFFVVSCKCCSKIFVVAVSTDQHKRKQKFWLQIYVYKECLIPLEFLPKILFSGIFEAVEISPNLTSVYLVPATKKSYLIVALTCLSLIKFMLLKTIPLGQKAGGSFTH